MRRTLPGNSFLCPPHATSEKRPGISTAIAQRDFSISSLGFLTSRLYNTKGRTHLHPHLRLDFIAICLRKLAGHPSLRQEPKIGETLRPGSLSGKKPLRKSRPPGIAIGKRVITYASSPIYSCVKLAGSHAWRALHRILHAGRIKVAGLALGGAGRAPLSRLVDPRLVLVPTDLITDA